MTSDDVLLDQDVAPYVDPEGTWAEFRQLFPEVSVELTSPDSLSYHLTLGDRQLLRYADACRMYSFVKGALFAIEQMQLKSQ